jgi:NADH:quinone reductase (non-electrogenic)
VLVPAAADALDIHVLASGGIADGRGLVAALALGAAAVNMGTRFVATDEAPVHEDVKRQIVANSEHDTDLVFRSFRNTARVARNTVSQRIREIESRPGTTFADVADLASGARGRERVLRDGDEDGGPWWAGVAQGLVRDVVPVAELISRMVEQVRDLVQRQLPG